MTTQQKDTSIFKIKTIKDGNNWYAMQRIKNNKSITNLSQIVKQGKTKQEAINKLKLSL